MHKFTYVFVLFFFLGGTLQAKEIKPAEREIPEPYRSIVDLPFDAHGWFGHAEAFGNIIANRPIKTVIEIGSWLGASTRFLAGAIPEDGVVYAVDTWCGSPDEPEHLRDPRMPFLYQLFLSNVKHAGLTHKIVPVRMASLEAARALNVQADMIYIDGAHDTVSVLNDILHWYLHLKPDGFMCGDDWLWPSVQAAVIQGAQHLGKTVQFSNNLWWFE